MPRYLFIVVAHGESIRPEVRFANDLDEVRGAVIASQFDIAAELDEDHNAMIDSQMESFRRVLSVSDANQPIASMVSARIDFEIGGLDLYRVTTEAPNSNASGSWTLGGLIEVIRDDRQMSKKKRDELVAIAESIAQPSAYPVEVNHDRIADSQWIAGANFGFGRGLENDQDSFDEAIEARMRDITESRRTDAQGMTTDEAGGWVAVMDTPDEKPVAYIRPDNLATIGKEPDIGVIVMGQLFQKHTIPLFLGSKVATSDHDDRLRAILADRRYRTDGDTEALLDRLAHMSNEDRDYQVMNEALKKHIDESQALALIDEIGVLLGIGSAVRDRVTIMTNIGNMQRHAACLHALEREFFTVERPDDEGENDGEPWLDTITSWGADPAQYVEQAREALLLRNHLVPACEEWANLVSLAQEVREAEFSASAAINLQETATSEVILAIEAERVREASDDGVKADHQFSVDETMCSLLLVGDTEHITDELVATWTNEQRRAAVDWAIALHYKASDNDDVVVPKRPAHTLDERTEFERWAVGAAGGDIDLREITFGKVSDGRRYESLTVEAMWVGWKARGEASS